MSLRNRARKLQRRTPLTYQQALARLKTLGARPAQLARETGWPLDVCDRFLVDGRAPIAVVETPSARDDATDLERLCEALRIATNAREVLVIDTLQRALAHVTVEPRSRTPTVAALEHLARRRNGAPVDALPPSGGELVWSADRLSVVAALVGRRAEVIVVFDEGESARELVRLTVGRFVDGLKRALAGETLPPPPPVLDEHDALALLSRSLGLPAIDLEAFAVGDEALAMIPIAFARHHTLFPVARDGATLIIAIADRASRGLADTVRMRTGLKVELVVASRRQILEAIERHRDRAWAD